MPDAEAAQHLLFEAWDAEQPARRAELARRALELDPEACDAYVILALDAGSSDEKIALLREGVAIGRRRWAKEIRRPGKHPFWLDHETRPFMRAVHDLALALWETVERDEAASLVDFLLELNEDDNQGVRYLALSWHAARGDWPAVERLLARYEEDGGTEFIYAQALDAFRCDVDAAERLEDAISVNPYVPGFLLDPAATPKDDAAAYVEWGSPEEAADYARHARAAWENVPGALEWLAKEGMELVELVGELGGEELTADQQELEELLAACPEPDAALGLSELDGFLCAILVSPHDPQPDEWLPHIWGGGRDEPFPDDPARSGRLVELVRHRQAEIVAAFLRGNAYVPIYDVARDGEILWMSWIEGFSRAMPIGGENWDSLLEDGDEDLDYAFIGLMRLLAYAHGKFPELPEEEEAIAVDLLPHYAETIYRRQRGLKRITTEDGFEPVLEPVRTGPKVGRNDPCPCGSGRKYKKCCGAG